MIHGYHYPISDISPAHVHRSSVFAPREATCLPNAQPDLLAKHSSSVNLRKALGCAIVANDLGHPIAVIIIACGVALTVSSSRIRSGNEAQQEEAVSAAAPTKAMFIVGLTLQAL